MDFKDEENHFAFILVTMFFFLSIGSFLLIFNFFDVPKINTLNDYVFGIDNYVYPFAIPFNWRISFDDKVISNLENIVIWVFFLWGFLRGIDLLRFLEKYKNNKNI